MENKGDWKDYINRKEIERYNEEKEEEEGEYGKLHWYQCFVITCFFGFLFWVGLFSGWFEHRSFWDITFLVIGIFSIVFVVMSFIIMLQIIFKKGPDILE